MDPYTFRLHSQEDEELDFPNFETTDPYNFDSLSSNPLHFSNGYYSGPQQTRRHYDPKSLLNPKSATSGPPALKKNESADTADEAESGAASMIEYLNNVHNRENSPTRKRKVQVIDDDDSEGNSKKKQKAAASHFGSGGFLSEHMKEERKRHELGSGPNNDAIDLTADDNPVLQPDDDDVQIVREEIKQEPNESVCLGIMHGSANIFRIPSAAQSSLQAVGKDHWPRMRITFRRETMANSLVDLLDRQKLKFATLDARSANAICPLLTGVSMNRMRLKMYLSSRPKKAGDVIGKRVSESAKLEIEIYAPEDKSRQIAKFLSQKGIFLSKPVGDVAAKYVDAQRPQNFNPAKTQSRMISVQCTVEEMRRETSNMFDSLTKAEDLPQVDADTSIIGRPLLVHQKQALHFLMEHERDDFDGIQDAPQHSLWKYKPKDNGKSAWYHVITGHEVHEKPEPIQGGILADVMGLGKTLSILALIAETREAGRRFRNQEPPASDTIARNARGSLVICPKSVLSNWQQQIREHTLPNTLKDYVYHGPNRTQDLHKLSKYDIVLTTYNTVAAELGRGQKMRALASLNWFRVVLDEAHSIRTHSTQISKACCALSAERRWAVTGTPVQNSLNDMGALIKFLQLKPFDDPMTWAQWIMTPFKTGQVNVIEHLQILVGSITLRRTKGALETQLPGREEQRERLTFSNSEAILYELFGRKCRTQFHRITQGGNALKGKAYAHILKSIGRLRAICAHGKEMLTEEDMREIEGDDSMNAIVLDVGDEPELQDSDELVSEKLAYETFSMMVDSDAALCQNCGDKLPKIDEEEDEDDEEPVVTSNTEDSDEHQDGEAGDEENNSSDFEAAHKRDQILGYMTPCFHLICRKCIGRHEQEAKAALTPDHHYNCQYCEQYVRYWLFELHPLGFKRFKDSRAENSKKPKTAHWDENTYNGPHTKVKALLEDLRKSAEETKALPSGEPPIRSVVFSGWTSYLDLIEHALTKHEIGFTRIDGNMSIKQRSQALDVFNTVDDVTVLLVSIKAGGQGLNFTAASKAYVMEPQFNPGVEQQAVDRVHRIGQKRAVTIKHYIMKGSIEEGILDLQKKKEDLAKLSMEKKRSRVEESKERMEQLKVLFK